jgi:hypothetical protein
MSSFLSGDLNVLPGPSRAARGARLERASVACVRGWSVAIIDDHVSVIHCRLRHVIDPDVRWKLMTDDDVLRDGHRRVMLADDQASCTASSRH